YHSETEIHGGFDVLSGEGLPEAWPSCAGLEFSIGTKEGRVAADTAIKPLLMQIPIRAGEFAFGIRMPRDLENCRRQLLLPFAFGLHNLRNPDRPQPLTGIRKLDDGYFLWRTKKKVVEAACRSAKDEGSSCQHDCK